MDSSPGETKDRLSFERMQQLAGAPMSAFWASGLLASQEQFDALLKATVEAHGSASVEQADLLMSFAVLLFHVDLDEDDPTPRKASLAYLKRATAAYRAAFGHDHPEVAVALHSYADALLQVEREAGRSEAYSALEQAYSIRLTALGPDNLETIATANRLGKVRESVFAENIPRSGSANPRYLGFREAVLGTKASDLGLTPTGPKDVYGIIMEMDVGGATAMITSFRTGDAGLFDSSTGGGMIASGQASPEMAAAAGDFVNTARLYMHAMSRAASQPLPAIGEVIFYVLTSDGIYGAAAPKQELQDNFHAFSLLYTAGQRVLTLLQQRQNKNRERED